MDRWIPVWEKKYRIEPLEDSWILECLQYLTLPHAGVQGASRNRALEG